MMTGEQLQAMMDFDLYMGWIKSMKDGQDDDGAPLLVFDDGGYIYVEDDGYSVIIGNIQPSFSGVLDAIHFLWENHSKVNVLG